MSPVRTDDARLVHASDAVWSPSGSASKWNMGFRDGGGELRGLGMGKVN